MLDFCCLLCWWIWSEAPMWSEAPNVTWLHFCHFRSNVFTENMCEIIWRQTDFLIFNVTSAPLPGIRMFLVLRQTTAGIDNYVFHMNQPSWKDHAVILLTISLFPTSLCLFCFMTLKKFKIDEAKVCVCVCVFVCVCQSPWYDLHGWLGVSVCVCVCPSQAIPQKLLKSSSSNLAW